jgi:uncharacterized protein YhaN
LHVIYGRNEAGKSSALRGLSALFFGIPERTSDNHRHPNKDLCIRASIEDKNGTIVDLVRRKRRNDSLRDSDDHPLAEAVMSELVGGIGQELFDSVYGLDHERLRSGGEALLKGGGDIGASLFDAGLGGHGIHRVLAELETEADALFKPRARTKPALNVALDNYREAVRACRDQLQAPEQWQRQKEELEQKRRDRAELEASRRGAREQFLRLSRIGKALEPAARRKQRLTERDALGSIAKLPERAEQRRIAATRLVDQCRRDIDRIERDAERKRQQRDALRVPERLIALPVQSVQDVASELAVVRQARHDCSRLAAEIAAGEAEIFAILKRLGKVGSIEDAEALRLGTAEQARIRELVAERLILGERRERAEQEERRAQSALDKVERELLALPPPADAAPLKRLVAALQARGDLEARHHQLSAECEAQRRAAMARLVQLAPFEGDLDSLRTLKVPSPETVEHFEVLSAAFQQEKEHVRRELEAARVECAEFRRQIASIEQAGDVPREEQLERARKQRDETWRSIRSVWLKSGATSAEPSSDNTSLEAFERAIAAADDLADRLRREAGRVTQLAGLQADLEHAENRVIDFERVAKQLLARSKAFEKDWIGAWQAAGLRADTPRQMQGWLRRHALAVEAAERLSALETELAALERIIAETRALLAAALVEHGLAARPQLTLFQLFDLATAYAEQVASFASRRHMLAASAEQAADQLQTTAEETAVYARELSAWNERWRTAVAALGFAGDRSVAEVEAVIEELVLLDRKRDDLGDKRRTFDRIRKSSRDFSERLRALLERHAPELLELDEEVAFDQLAKIHARAHAAASERERLELELRQLDEERGGLREQRAEAEAELEVLKTAVGVTDVAELELAEHKAKRAQELTRDIDEAEASLRRTAHEEGLTLDELLERVQGVDQARVQPELRELERELEELDEACMRADGEIESLELGLHRYSDARAVEAAQDAQAHAAEVRRFAERYARVRLATILLERQVERYREQSQGPVLSRASELYTRLTLGRYVALRAGLEERVLRSVRHDGAEIEVEGLSEGTRYQLYLALRLASLERHLAQHEPLPLILDDALIHFDEDRVQAGLSVLGELAQRMQILYFTHHARHLEIARQAVPSSVFAEHALDGWHRPQELAVPVGA